MPNYSELTREQQSDIAAYDGYMRGLISELSALAKRANIDHWNRFATDNVDPVILTVTPGDTIPNSTNLANSKDLTKEEFLSAQTILRDLVTTLKTNRGLVIKAAGINASE